MKAYFYTHNKKSNSTARPMSTPVELDIYLKTPSTKESPTIIVSGMREWNYCYIPDFARYYYIIEHVFLSNERTQLELVTDILATYRDNIRQFKTNIVRDPIGEDDIIDDLLVPKDLDYFDVSEITTGFSRAGCYIMSVASSLHTEDMTGTPTTVNYILTTSQFRRLCAKMFDRTSYDGLGSVMDITQQTICNPSQYIVGCKWFPFNVNDLKGNVPDAPFKVGWITIQDGESDLYPICPFTMKTVTIDVPAFFTAHTKDNAWRKNPLFSETKMYVPNIGIIDVPLESARRAMKAEYIIDIMSGTCNFFIKNPASGLVIASAASQIGYDVPINSINYHFPEFNLGTAFRMISGFASDIKEQGVKSGYQEFMDRRRGVYDEQGETSKLDNVWNTINAALQPTPSTIGASNSHAWASYYPNILLYWRYKEPINKQFINENFGYPCNIYSTIQTVNQTGYYQFSYGDIPIDASPEERNALSTFLRGGFYYE